MYISCTQNNEYIKLNGIYKNSNCTHTTKSIKQWESINFYDISKIWNDRKHVDSIQDWLRGSWQGPGWAEQRLLYLRLPWGCGASDIRYSVWSPCRTGRWGHDVSSNILFGMGNPYSWSLKQTDISLINTLWDQMIKPQLQTNSRNCLVEKSQVGYPAGDSLQSSVKVASLWFPDGSGCGTQEDRQPHVPLLPPPPSRSLPCLLQRFLPERSRVAKRSSPGLSVSWSFPRCPFTSISAVTAVLTCEQSMWRIYTCRAHDR